MVSYGIAAVIAVVVGVVAAAIAFFCGISYRRKVAEQKLHPHGHGWSIVNNVDQWSWE